MNADIECCLALPLWLVIVPSSLPWGLVLESLVVVHEYGLLDWPKVKCRVYCIFHWQYTFRVICYPCQTKREDACLISTNLALPSGQVSGSVLSVYSGDFGSVDAQGMVQFALDYDEKNREFQIFVSQCQDLAVVDDKKGRSDP